MIYTIKTSGVILKRTPSKLYEIITWIVYTEDMKFRLGVIRQLNDDWRWRRFGWKEFRERFWLGSKFSTNSMVVARTRTEVINQLKDK